MPLSINKRKNELFEILDKFNEDEICEFLTISESDLNRNDLSIKIATIQKMLMNISDNTVDLLIRKLSPQKLIDVISNNNLYSPYNIMYIANSLQSEVRDDLLKQKIKYDLTRSNDCKKNNKTSILDRIDGVEYISEIKSKQEFDLIYNLYSKYLTGHSDKEICEKLGNQSQKFFETIFSIDKFKNKSIDMFFIRKDWFKVIYDINKEKDYFSLQYNYTKSENLVDGISFFLKKINCFITENSFNYAYKELVKQIEKDEVAEYIKTRKENIVIQILTGRGTLPESHLFKRILNKMGIPKINEPLLLMNPNLIFEKHFNDNISILINNFGLTALIGNKEQQEQIAENLLKIKESNKLVKNNVESGTIKETSDKLKKLIEKSIPLNERNKDLLFVFNFVSKIENLNNVNESHFDIKLYNKEIIKHKNKDLIYFYLKYIGSQNRETIFENAQALYEKDVLAESLSGQNKKMISRL